MKTKRIPGALNNLTSSYFSTLNYYDGGYVADWLWKIGIKKDTFDLKIDLVDSKFNPSVFECEALKYPINKLIEILKKEIKNIGLDYSLIKNLFFEIELRKSKIKEPKVSCCPTIILKDGSEFRGNKIETIAYDLESIL